MPRRQVTNALSTRGHISNGLIKHLEDSGELKKRTVQKNETILMPKMVANEVYYMPKGIAKFYAHDDDNEKVTLQLLGDNSFIFVDEFFLGKENKDIYVVMLEASDLFVLTTDQMNFIYANYAEARELTDIIRAEIGHKVKLHLSILQMDASKRLLLFSNGFKDLYGRLSVKEICAYLHICEKTYKRSRTALFLKDRKKMGGCFVAKDC